MDYTQKDLDRACAVILERSGVSTSGVKAMQEGLSLPVLCKYAAEEAFKNEFPQGAEVPNVEVHHACNILRRALRDLDNGQFQFKRDRGRRYRRPEKA